MPDGFEPPIRELQSHALPLGYGTICHRGEIIAHLGEDVKSYPKVSLGIIVRDALYYLFEAVFVSGILAVFDPSAYQIAGYAPEVIVPCI